MGLLSCMSGLITLVIASMVLAIGVFVVSRGWLSRQNGIRGLAGGVFIPVKQSLSAADYSL
jgi:hypothetical protein